MFVDCYEPEDVFARVPEVATQTDPVLKTLDRLLEDDQLYQQVRTDLGKRYRYTLVHGRHSTPVEVILRMLLCKHLYSWSRPVVRGCAQPNAWHNSCIGNCGARGKTKRRSRNSCIRSSWRLQST